MDNRKKKQEEVCPFWIKYYYHPRGVQDSGNAQSKQRLFLQTR